MKPRSTRPFILAVAALALSVSSISSVGAQAACDPFQTTPDFDPSVPTGRQVLGFDIGSQEVTSAESDEYVAAVDAASDRVVSDVAGYSVANRPITYAIVGQESNVTPTGLAAIKANIDALRDPSTPATEAAALAQETPAILWVAANVHGSEESGTDASLRVLYELAARTDCAAEQILDNAIVVLMPTQNPDGREENTRRNLYGFDMNRDWFARTQVETDAKIEVVREYPPQLFIDDHEMGTTTFFFPPNADPIYHEVADPTVDWINDIYGASMAAEFERQDIPFFHYDPYDFFAMIYGDTVPGVGFASAGMTFEKHNGDPISVRTYEQYVAVWTSLSQGALNKEQILSEWHGAFAEAYQQGQAGLLEPNFVQESDSKLFQQVPNRRIRNYFILDEDPAKSDEVQALVRRLQRMEVEVYELTAPLNVPDFERYGRAPSAKTLPVGTYWIPMAQAQKHWVQALMHEDPYIPVDVTYDVSAWSNPLLMNVDAGFSGRSVNPTATLLAGELAEPPPPTIPANPPSVALLEGPGTTAFESTGHVRWLFEQAWGLDYDLLQPGDITAGDLAGHDVLVVPDRYLQTTMQALGKRGKSQLIEWVKGGGRYIGWQGGAQLAARLGISTAVLSQNHSNTPGSLFRVSLDSASPLSEDVGDFAYVMFEEDLVMKPGKTATGAITYPSASSGDWFVSGLGVGAEELGGTAWAVDETVGSGRAIVFSTDPNFRAWSNGTQQVLWNAIFGADPAAAAGFKLGSPARADAVRAAQDASLALPNLVAPMELSVAQADEAATAEAISAYGVRFVRASRGGTTTFLIDNPGALGADEHPFATTLLGNLTKHGVDIRYFHMR